jgi:hypothetical protein
VTPSNIRIHRSTSCDSVAPGGKNGRSSSTAARQIDRFGLEVLEAALDPFGQVLSGVTLDGLCRQAPAGLRGDVNGVQRPLAPQPGHQALASPVAIYVGGIDEIRPGVNRGMHARIDVSSSTSPQLPPIAQAPKLMAETRISVRPSCRYSINPLNLKLTARK